MFHPPVCADTDGEHVLPLPELGGEVAPNDSSEDHYFFDSLESPPELSFFDSFANLSTMSRSQDSLDFLDCFPRPTESVILTDWMDLSLFYDESTTVHCVWDDDMAPHRSSLPSHNAYMALERGGIPHSFDDCSDASCFSVIIDSGASLAISPCETDFIGTIKNLKLELGGNGGQDGNYWQGRG